MHNVIYIHGANADSDNFNYYKFNKLALDFYSWENQAKKLYKVYSNLLVKK